MERVLQLVILIFIAFFNASVVAGAIAPQGRTSLDISVGYASSERQANLATESLLVPTGPDTFLLLPASYIELHSSLETQSASLSLRHGLTDRIEPFGRISSVHTQLRAHHLNDGQSLPRQQYSSVWLGVNYRFKAEGKTPGFVGFYEQSLMQKATGSGSLSASRALGGTLFASLDPVVFNLSAAYRLNRAGSIEGLRYQPGSSVVISPSVGVVFNDRITTSAGVQWTRLASARLAGERVPSRRSNVDALMSVGFALGLGRSLNLAFGLNASGQDRADLRIDWMHLF